MQSKWVRNLSFGACAILASWSASSAANAQNYYHGHHQGCSPYAAGRPNYSYRPITTLPYYGTNYGLGGYSGYSSYSSNYGNYYSNRALNNFGGGYGVGGFPIGGSYGGGAFPRGGSYGGGAFPRGGSYGGGGISLYIGR